MTLGMDIGGVRRTRSAYGEVNAGFAGEVRKARDAAPVTVKVEATRVADGTYNLRIEVDGQAATRTGVEADDLGDTIGRLINKVNDAVAEQGGTQKYRQPQESTFRGTDFTRKPPREAYSGDRG